MFKTFEGFKKQVAYETDKNRNKFAMVLCRGRIMT
jgi:hypothetical protein